MGSSEKVLQQWGGGQSGDVTYLEPVSVGSRQTLQVARASWRARDLAPLLRKSQGRWQDPMGEVAKLEVLYRHPHPSHLALGNPC